MHSSFQVQFNRFFRKKNPDTVAAMTRTLGLQMPRRMSSDVIHKNVPLIKYLIIRLDDLNGTVTMPRKPKDDDNLPHVNQHGNHGDGHHHAFERDAVSLPTRFSRAKSGVSTRSYPMSSRSFPRATGKNIALHESLPRNISLNLPHMPPAMNTYLNTQVQHIIGTENNENADPNAQRPATDGGVVGGAKNQTLHLPASQANQLPTTRSGIFFKLMQVTQPNVDKEDLAIDQEEFNYLCQLRRRIARQLNSYYPFASLESFLKLDEDQRPKKERKRRAQPAKSANPQTRKKLSKSLPNIRGAIKGGARKPSMHDNDDSEVSDEDIEVLRDARGGGGGGQRRAHVAFSMPPS